MPSAESSRPIGLCIAELLFIRGADAQPFAHAQFGSNVKALGAGRWQWSAWLDARGRVRFFFLLLKSESGELAAWLPLGGAQPMAEALSRFVMRSVVQLDAQVDWIVHSMQSDCLDRPVPADAVMMFEDGFVFAQPGTSPRIAWIAPAGGDIHRHLTGTSIDELNHWRLQDIGAALPLLAPALAGEFVPQALDLERFDAVRFDKGCFPGQEIAARLHFRGGDKHHLHRMRIEGAAPTAPVPILDQGGNRVGHLLYAADTSSSASEAVGVLADSHARIPCRLTAGGMEVQVMLKN